MDDITVLVLADPSEPQLAMLECLPQNTSIAVGNSPEAFERLAPDATAIFNWSGSGELLQQAFAMSPRVRWVHSRAAGLDGQLFPDLVEGPVMLTNGSGVFSQPLGEWVIGAALFFAKDFRRLVRSQEAGVWDQFDCVELSKQTMGIIGYGDIGRAVARRAKALEMKVLGVRRHPDQSSGDAHVDEVYGMPNRFEVLKRSDYVVVAAPLTPETRGLIGEAELNAMQATAVIMNVGRGPVIDEAALIRALEQRRIRGAALDVFDREPLPEGHAFYKLDNVLLSPHCADHTPGWLETAMQFFLDNFERFRKGEPLKNIVDKRLGY